MLRSSVPVVCGIDLSAGEIGVGVACLLEGGGRKFEERGESEGRLQSGAEYGFDCGDAGAVAIGRIIGF